MQCNTGRNVARRTSAVAHVGRVRTTELSLDLKIDSVFWVSNEDIGIVSIEMSMIDSFKIVDKPLHWRRQG